MPNILIDLAAEFTGKKAFDKAGKSTTGLEKSVKSLGKTLGLTFSTAAVLAYGKASVKAAAADLKAQQQLALALKNVGLERDAATAEGYIQRIEKEYAIVDDKLRPSYSRLAIATRDTAETQRLMGIAMDISASTGKDLDSVTSALAKAFLGSNTALSKLGVGISKADLATKSFDEVTKDLAATFAGAAIKSADSVSGSMDKLAIATNNAKETIGVGLIEAFANLAGNGDVDQAVSKIDSVSASLSKMIVVASKLKWYDWVIGGITGGTITDITKFKGMGNVPLTGGSNMDTQRSDAAAKAAAAKTIAANKAIAANKIKADKLAAANKAKLDKAAAVFDIQKIQIAAALKGKISEEEKTRLLLMQAIADEDTVKAEALQKKLEEIQKQNAKIAADLLAIGQAKDPFATWAGSLALAVAQLSKLNSGITMIPGVTYNPAQSKDRNYDDALAAAAAAKAAADKAAADKAAAEAAAILGGASEKAAAEKAAADAAAAKLAKDAADKAAAAALGGAGITFNEGQNPDRNYDTKAAADAAAAAAVAVTNGSPVAGVNFNPGQSRDRNYDSGFATQTPVTINVTNTGSVIMQDEFVKVINDAVTIGLGTGLKIRPPGSLPEFE